MGNGMGVFAKELETFAVPNNCVYNIRPKRLSCN
jgi:hypothetical protein